MDLNYLLHRPQLSLMLRDVVVSREARRALQQDLRATFGAVAA